MTGFTVGCHQPGVAGLAAAAYVSETDSWLRFDHTTTILYVIIPLTVPLQLLLCRARLLTWQGSIRRSGTSG
jgi:hypothetical protein